MGETLAIDDFGTGTAHFHGCNRIRMCLTDKSSNTAIGTDAVNLNGNDIAYCASVAEY